LSDAFVTKLNAAGSALVYSTFLGGSLYDEGRGIDLDGSGNVFAIGSTSSDNFPTANPMQGSNGGGLNNHDDAFVVKLGAAGSTTTTLSSLTLNPTSVTGGASLQGTVTLSSAAPSGGAVVMLASSNGTVASVPPSVTVAAGATSASFTVTTTPVSVSTTVNISATYAGLTKTATLIVMPPATADTVAITLADYRLSSKRLSAQATSTNATATLRVYVTATGQLIGTLTNNGGMYSGQFKWPTNPQNITVRSSLGGSSSATVTVR
jgi:Beta-propeller repeat